MEIRELKAEEKQSNKVLDLLYLTDPHKEAVNDYINRGTCYIVISDNEIIGECVLLPTRPFIIELINIAIDKNYQRKGIAKKLIEYSIKIAKEKKFKTFEVGTGNSGIYQLALYQKCGFIITHIDFDFFKKHYSEAIFENGIECKHMIRMSLDL